MNSILPCAGNGGRYELWMHYLEPSGKNHGAEAHSVRLPLHGDTAAVEAELGLPELPEPNRLLELLDRAPYTAGLARHIGRPAIATLVRHCNLPRHRDGISVAGGSRSYREIAARVVWAPPAAARIALRRCDLALDMSGVGYAHQTALPHRIGPIVAAPLTAAEQNAVLQRGRVEVIATASSQSGEEPALYAVLHPDGSGGTLERVRSVAPRSA